MANRYWVAITGGNWNSTSSWSDTDGGASGFSVPTSADDVYFTAYSISGAGRTITINAAAFCNNINFTGVLNTPYFNCSSSYSLSIYGSMTLIAGMTTTGLVGRLYFKSTGAGNTITTAGKTVCGLNFDGVGGAWAFQDDVTCSGGLVLTNGSVDFNNFNATFAKGIDGNNSNIRGLDLGNGTITLQNAYDWDFTTTTNLTFACGTSTIIFMSNGNFKGGGLTYYNFESQSVLSTGFTISGDNTFNDIKLYSRNTYIFAAGSTQTITTWSGNGASSASMITLQSSDSNVFHISCASGTITKQYYVMSNCDATGGATFNANFSNDAGDNTGWTFSPPEKYWVAVDGGAWNSSTSWSDTDGGASGANVPTQYDDVYFTANSITSTGKTILISVTAAKCKNLDFTGLLNSPTFSLSVTTLTIYGSLTLIPGMSWSQTGNVYFSSTSSGNTITQCGKTFGVVVFNAAAGAWAFQDAFACTDLYVTAGSLDFNDKSVNISKFISSGTNVRYLSLGTGIITATTEWTVEATNLTLSCETSKIVLSGATFRGGGCTYYDFQTTVGASIYGSNTFNELRVDASRVLQVEAGTTQTVSSLICSGTGSSGSGWCYLRSRTAGTPFTLSCAGAVSLKYCQLKDCHTAGGGTFTATFSLDTGGNLGWTITRPTRYWVATSGGAWTANSSWAETSGGASGASYPSSNDIVYFDANSITSGGRTITIAAGQACYSLDCSGLLNSPTINMSTFTSTTDIILTSACTLSLTAITMSSSGTFNGGGKSFALFTFNGSALTIIGDNTFIELRLKTATPKTVNFTAGSNQTITRIGFTGASGNLLTLQSTSSGTPYTITQVGSNIANYCSIQDCTYSGAAFKAYNSTNVSGNSNISFEAGSPAPGRYWINDTGTYSDTAHWAAYSNGVGGEAVATSSQDVYFDEYSFSRNTRTVTLDSDLYNCKDFNIVGVTNSPTFGSGSTQRSLNVYGNIKFDGVFTSINMFTLHIKNSVPMTITHNTSLSSFHTITVTSTSTQTLASDLSLIFGFSLYRGNIHTADFDIAMGYLTYASTAGTSTVNLGSSTMTLTGGVYPYSIVGMTVNPGTSKIVLTSTATRFGGGMNYYDVEMQGSLPDYFTGSNTFHDLKLTAGKTYKIPADSTQTFASLSGNGSPGNLVTLISSTAGTHYHLVSSVPNIVNVRYWDIKDSYASPADTFYVRNGVDSTGNSGWTFLIDTDSRYWVGGTGNWSSSSHWAYTSGGISGADVPESTNSVYFDSNSFAAIEQVVTLDSDGVCGDLVWTGATNAPAFVGAANLDIYGALTLIADMTQSGITYSFLGSGSCAITTAGQFPDYVVINGAGTFTLQDSLAIDAALTFTKGTLDTNGQAVTSDLTSTGAETRVLTLGATVWDCWIAWNISGTNFTLNAGTSTVKMHSNFVGFAGAGLTYNNVEILGDGAIVSGDNTFNDLKLTKNTNTVFTAGSTQTFASLSGDGIIGEFVSISSTDMFTPYAFVCTGAAVTRDRWTIQDCHASGAVFKATNGIDVAGNTGWLFVTALRYWVGDSGNWSDTGHWSYSSGGAPGAEVPTAIEDVYFDSNSFTGVAAVTLDAAGECKDLDWGAATNTPTFADPSALGVSVYGSLTLGAMSIPVGAGIFQMCATGIGKTVTLAGNAIYQLDFSGIGGGWTLQDDVNAVYFSIEAGALDTNGKAVACAGLTSLGVGVRSLTFGASEITVDGDLELSTSANLTVTPGTSKIVMSKDASDFYGYGKAFYNLQVTGDGVTIHGDNIFNDIELTPGNTTKFTSGSQQTITSLTGTGSSGNLVTIEASTPGAHFSLGKQTGTIAVEYWSIKDSYAVTPGDAVFNALSHCVDEGGNSGWNFPNLGDLKIYFGATQITKAYLGSTEISTVL